MPLPKRFIPAAGTKTAHSLKIRVPNFSTCPQCRSSSSAPGLLHFAVIIKAAGRCDKNEDR